MAEKSQQAQQRQAPEAMPETFRLSELEVLRRVAASQIFVPRKRPPWHAGELLDMALNSNTHLSIMLMRRTTISSGKTAVPYEMRLQVLEQLNGGRGYRSVYLCHSFVRDVSSGDLLPSGNVVIKVPRLAEVTKGVSVVTPAVLEDSWPHWQGAFEGQHCSNVAGAHAVGMCAAAIRVPADHQLYWPDAVPYWRQSAAWKADQALAAAVARAQAKLGDAAVQSIMAAAPADPLEQELVLSFPVLVMPQAVGDLLYVLSYVDLFDNGIDAVPATLSTHQVLVGVNHLHEAHMTERDIKPTNIMVRPHPRIYTSRLPKQVDASELLLLTSEYMVGNAGGGAKLDDMFCGYRNKGYSAPEAWQGRCFHNNKCDSFSTGMQLATLLTGSYEGLEVIHSESELQELIQRAVDACAKYPELQQEVEGFLQASLQMDPSQRATPQQLLQTPLMQRAQALQEQLLDPNQREMVIEDLIAGCTDAAKQLAYRASWEQLRQHLTKPEQRPLWLLLRELQQQSAKQQPQQSAEQQPQQSAEQQPQQSAEQQPQQSAQQQPQQSAEQHGQQQQPVVLRRLMMPLEPLKDCFLHPGT